MIPELPDEHVRKPAFTPVKEDEWYENRKAVRKKLMLIPVASLALLFAVGLALSYPRLPDVIWAFGGGALSGRISWQEDRQPAMPRL